MGTVVELFLHSPRESLLGQTVDFLRRDPPTAGFFDLSRTLVLLPTREVGRRLRARLAEALAEEERGLFPPAVATPGGLFRHLEAGEEPVLAEPERVLLAAEALGTLSPAERATAFGYPADQPPGPLDLLAWAEFWTEARSELAEAGHDFGSAAQAIAGGEEQERWQLLAHVEETYRERLRAEEEAVDPDERARAIVRDPDPDSLPYDRIVLAGLADFPRRVEQWLAAIDGALRIEILLFADPEEREQFDLWGRPLPASARTRAIDLPTASLRKEVDLYAAAERAADTLTGVEEPARRCVFGVNEPGHAVLLEHLLRERGQPVFHPAERPLAASGPGQYLESLHGFLVENEAEAAAAWFQSSLARRWLRARGGPPHSEWLRAVDRLREDHLPSTGGDLLRLLAEHPAGPRDPAAKERIDRLREIRAAVDHGADLRAWMVHLRTAGLLDDLREEEGMAGFAEGLDRLLRRLDAFPGPGGGAAGGGRDGGGDGGEEPGDGGRGGDGGGDPRAELEAWCFRASLQGGLEPRRAGDEVEILGWLELPWDERPWLQILDTYDEVLPQTLGAHPLLSDGLRERLGMAHRLQRTARDAYLLSLLTRLHDPAAGGRLDCWIPASDTSGQKVLPSRLLGFAAPAETAERQRHLQRPPTPRPARTVQKPLRLTAPQRGAEWLAELRDDERGGLHPSWFGSWLRCPRTFYLEKVCGLAPVDTRRVELDPPAFGSLFHTVVERLERQHGVLSGRPGIDPTDPGPLRKALPGALAAAFADRCGSDPGALLLVQQDMLRRRLEKTVDALAAAAADGWRTWEVETRLRVEDFFGPGLPLTGRIDRIEHLPGTNRFRIIDFKTSAKATPPEKKHLKQVQRRQKFRAFQAFPVAGQDALYWLDLQLPLYTVLLAHAPGIPADATLEVAYLNAPANTRDTQLAVWEGFSPALRESAVETARTIVQLWGEDYFSPPGDTFAQGPWAELGGTDTWHHWQAEGWRDLEDYHAARTAETAP